MIIQTAFQNRSPTGSLKILALTRKRTVANFQAGRHGEWTGWKLRLIRELRPEPKVTDQHLLAGLITSTWCSQPLYLERLSAGHGAPVSSAVKLYWAQMVFANSNWIATVKQFKMRLELLQSSRVHDCMRQGVYQWGMATRCHVKNACGHV